MKNLFLAPSILVVNPKKTSFTRWPIPLLRMDDENIPDEEIAAEVAVGASAIEHWPAVFGVAVVWSG